MVRPIYLYCIDLFPAEIRRNLSPFRGFPLDDGIAVVVSGEPVLGPQDDLIQLFRLWRALQLSFALALAHPQDGVVGVAVDGTGVVALLPAQRQCVHDGQELADIVRAPHRYFSRL